jgi:hypothetical protein
MDNDRYSHPSTRIDGIQPAGARGQTVDASLGNLSFSPIAHFGAIELPSVGTAGSKAGDGR